MDYNIPMSTIDSIDQTIIRLLMEDGRMSNPVISNRIPDSTISMIRYRINRLLSKNIIRLSTVIIPGKVGFPVMANVFLRVETGSIRSIAEKMVCLESVSYVCNTLGNHDIGITIHARDNIDLYTTISNQIASLPGVKETTTEVVPLQLKDIYHWQIPDSIVPGLIPPRKPPYFSRRLLPRKIDAVDFTIVNFLMEDPLISAASIARRIGNISPRSISSRIEMLVNQDVIRITAIVNPEKVGFPVKADIDVQVESMPLFDAALRLAELEQTSWVACAIDGSHINVQVCVQDIQELYRFVSDVIHKVPGIIRTSTSVVVQVFKDSYDWQIPESIYKESLNEVSEHA